VSITSRTSMERAGRAARLRRGYGVPSIDGQTDRSNGALGKATHLRQGYGATSIEGKAAMGSGERAGNRGRFKLAGVHKSIGKRASFKIPQSPAKMLQRHRLAMELMGSATQKVTGT